MTSEALDEFRSVDVVDLVQPHSSPSTTTTTLKQTKSSYLRFCEKMRPNLDQSLSFAEQGKELGVRWRQLGATGQSEYAQAYEADKAAYDEALVAAETTRETGNHASETETEASPSGPRPRLASKARHTYRKLKPVVDPLRPTTGLKPAGGARGGGGTGSRINTDPSHRGRISRISKAAATAHVMARKGVVKAMPNQMVAANKLEAIDCGSRTRTVARTGSLIPAIARPSSDPSSDKIVL